MMLITIKKSNTNKLPDNYALLNNMYYNASGFTLSTALLNTNIEKETTSDESSKTITICALNKSYKQKINKPQENINIGGWVKFVNNKLWPRNFGDDINFTFLPNITDCNHKLYKLKNVGKNYLMIGSIFCDSYIDRFTEVWGSGMLTNKQLTRKPHKVYAVRGPKTRDVVLKSKIECPEVYGDPALLLPYYYYPYVLKKYKIGIIPHHLNNNNETVLKLKTNKNIKLINMAEYIDWKTVIKLILECEFILSESLHGLIISEAYKIPNIFATFSKIEDTFKYDDFFLSVGKTPYKPYIIKNYTEKKLLSLIDKYNSTFSLDLCKLVNACPVKLNNINLHNNIKPYTGKILLCCIGKMENDYIREFVEYYKKLGFDNICLYDNNDINGEHFEDVINDYITNGFVILKDCRGKEFALIPSYTECYNTYKDEYDWIAFFDIDEYLHIDNNMNIKQFLSNDKYNDRGINCIRICWKQFTDSNIIKANGDYSVKKFKDYLPLNTLNASDLSKCIIKTLLDSIEFSSPHGPLTDDRIIAVNTKGELCSNTILMRNNTWDNACLNHYRFRTIEEFVLNKMVKLWPTKYMDGGKKGLNLDFYFRFNKKTLEKIKYAEYLLDKYNISKNK